MEVKYGLYNDEPVIHTFTGKWVNVFNPKPEMFCIEDIAHALSYQCRFGGHTKKFYSVAEHCCRGTETAKDKFTFLMHDCSEAYLLDIPRPIKLKLANYKEIEDGLTNVLAEKFGFKYPFDEDIKKVDDFMLQIEWGCIMLQEPRFNLTPWHPSAAKKKFLELFEELKP